MTLDAERPYYPSSGYEKQPYGMPRVIARANEIQAEFWEDAAEVGTPAAVWRLARALAFYDVEDEAAS